MARLFWSSLAGVACLALAGCGPAPSGRPKAVLVYCTFSGEPQARLLKRALEERGSWSVVLAPLSGADMLAAVEGTRAGDFAVFPEPPLHADLAARGLLRGEPLRYDFGFYAVALAPFALPDLARPGKRLGGFRKENSLGKALAEVLPQDLRAPIEANTCHRSDRADELLRLVRLGALDAAFLWAPPPAAADLQAVPVGGGACCPLRVAALSCSKLSDAEVAAIVDVWRAAEVLQALQERPAGRKTGEP